MDFTLTDDQSALVDAIDRLAQSFNEKPIDFHGFALSGTALEAALIDGEYFDIAQIPEYGPTAASLAVARLAQSPFAVEAALSMLLRSQLPGDDWPRRSEEHTSELQSIMRIPYAVVCLKKKTNSHHKTAYKTTYAQ